MTRPVRVLHIITRLIVGGAQENTLLTAIGQHNDPSMDVTLLAGIDPGPEGNLHEQCRKAGVRLELMKRLIRPIRPWTDVIALWELYRFLKKGDFDVVHTHSSKAGILGRFAARLAGVPIVVHTLHSLVFHEYQAAWKNWLYIRLKRYCAPMSDAIISVNQKTLDGALDQDIGTSEQHVKVFSGMRLEPFLEAETSGSVSEAKQNLGIPAEAPVVGKIARLFPLKGHDQFFEAAGKIAKLRPDCWFLLVGDGILRESLEAKASSLGIRAQTVFAGLLAPKDVPKHIYAMDVVVHSSLREGIARVLPQAGAVGKPVVTFDLDGGPEVVREGISGHVVPALDTDLMAERVVSLLSDPETRQRMGAEGRAFAEEFYPVERMVREINAIYARFYDRLALEAEDRAA